MPTRPPEPGAAIKKTAALLLLLLSLSACASTPQSNDSTDDGMDQTELEATEAAAIPDPDPFEGLNRRIFAFNQTLDSWVLKPVAKGYKVVAPKFVQRGVSNFFGNLGEIGNTANDVLQWKWGQAANDSGRFLINSTVGVAGVFDVAAKAGLPRSDGEDFGQTLAVWGVPAGAYLMLPLLGPATVRDGGATYVDYYTNPIRFVDPTLAEYGVHAVNLIDKRAEMLDAESLISGDSYTLLRDYYLQRRNFLIKDGQVEDDFGGDDFGDDYYDSGYDDYESDEDEY